VVLDHTRTKDFYRMHEEYQFYYHSRFHIHIQNSLLLLMKHNRKYDAIIVTRPDVRWFPDIFIIRDYYKGYYKGLTISVVNKKTIENAHRVFGKEYSFNPKKGLWEVDKVQKFKQGVVWDVSSTSIGPGDVAVHTTDSLLWGTQWSAGDWVHVGTPATMKQWVHLYNYSMRNYVTQGGGILQAAFMRSIGQSWQVVDFGIALLRAQCVNYEHLKEWQERIFDKKRKCYVVSKLKFH